jgi:hypothetical protein
MRTKYWSENLSGKEHAYLGIDGRILEWILRKYGGKL